MTTLVEFLLARIAEDEENARETGFGATPPVWVPERSRGDVHAVFVRDAGYQAAANLQRPIALHIARHNPARVLAECESKRGLIEEFTANSLSRFPDHDTHSPWALRMLGLLASPYVDHPDFREEWRP